MYVCVCDIPRICAPAKLCLPTKKVWLPMKQMSGRRGLSALNKDALQTIVGYTGSADMTELSTQTRLSKPESCQSLTDNGDKCDFARNFFRFHSGGALNCNSYCFQSPTATRKLTYKLATLIENIVGLAQDVKAIYASARFVRLNQEGMRKVIGSMEFKPSKQMELAPTPKGDGWKFKFSTEPQDREGFMANIRKQGFSEIDLNMTVPAHACSIQAKATYAWQVADGASLHLKCKVPRHAHEGSPSHTFIVNRYGVYGEEYRKLKGTIVADRGRLVSRETWIEKAIEERAKRDERATRPDIDMLRAEDKSQREGYARRGGHSF